MSQSIRNPLSKQVFIKGFIPVLILFVLTVAGFLINDYRSKYNENVAELQSYTNQLADHIELINNEASSISKSMGLAQTSGLFGDRIRSLEYLRQILDQNPNLTGSAFGYEPNIDQGDEYSLKNHQSQLENGIDSTGRFIPYWFRDASDNLTLAPLVDMDTSLYYNGVKNSFEKDHNTEIVITEPYVYQGKMIIEYVYPIIIANKFAGVASVDRALNDLDTLFDLNNEGNRSSTFILSSQNNFIAATNEQNSPELLTKNLADTRYGDIFNQLLRSEKSTIKFTHPSNGKSYIASVATIEHGQWTVIATKSVHDISRDIWPKVVFISLLFFLALANIFWLIRSTLKEISTRIYSAVSVAEDLDRHIQPAGYPLDTTNGDEVSELNAYFNGFIKRYLEINEVCLAIAAGDFSKRIIPSSTYDKVAYSLNTASKQRQLAEETLHHAIKKAELANETKNQFISMVSHELRTPLTSIRGSLGLIKAGATGSLAEKTSELIDIAHNNCERLILIVNDILDVEKISAGKISIKKRNIDLASVVSESLTANAAYAKKYSIFYELTELPSNCNVSADKERILQVLDNLLSNAAKFSEPNAKVQIRIVEKQDTLRVEITDKGPGISKEFEDKLFGRFSQANSNDNRKTGGTGLGLNISKSIVELHQGTIGFTNNPAGGATFWFELPMGINNDIALVERTVEENKNKDGMESNKRKVLICEDALDVAKMISFMLQENGIDSDIATNVTDAKSLLSKYTYNAMTLDLVLPDGDGETFLSDVRKVFNTEDLPVIIVSGYSENEKSVPTEDIAGWIQKPIDQLKLTNMVENLLPSLQPSKNILYFEGELDISNLAASILPLPLPEKYRIKSVSTLKEAYLALNDPQYSLILINLDLPDGHGREILNYLVRSNSSILIVVFSEEKLNDDQYLNVSRFTKSKTKLNDMVEELCKILGEDGT